MEEGRELQQHERTKTSEREKVRSIVREENGKVEKGDVGTYALMNLLTSPMV